MGKLFIVATPIGNMLDISNRAIETLKNVDLILSEDTRVSKTLLDYYQIKTKLDSYHEHSSDYKREFIINLLKAGKKIALISDSGTPLISDPGYKLTSLALENNIVIDSLPGPCSIINALVLSGLPTDKFFFVGFLPRAKNDAHKLITNLKNLDATIVLLESKERILSTIRSINEVLGNRKIAILREMTKKFQESLIFKATEMIDYLEANQLRGEIVVCIEKQDNRVINCENQLESNVLDAIEKLKNLKYSNSDIAKITSDIFNVSKSKVYSYLHKSILANII